MKRRIGMLKIGMIGLNGMGQTHIGGWNSIEDAKIVCACDIHAETMTDDMKKADIHYYNNLDEMLNNEKIDILDVCTPSFLHKSHALTALNRGINVLCEKPASLKPEDIDEMYDAAEKNHVKLMIAQVVRFWPEYLLVKNYLEEKKLGNILDGYFWRIGRYPKWSMDNWMLDEEKSGLVPYDLHIHDLDYVIFLLGMPQSVSANRSQLNEQAVSDHFWANYHYAGCDIKIESAWFQPPYPFSYGFRVLFEKGIIEYKDNTFTAYENGNEEPLKLDCTKIDNTGESIPDSSAYDREIRYFFDCVKNDEPVSIVNREEIKNVLTVIDKAVLSAEQNKTIEM